MKISGAMKGAIVFVAFLIAGLLADTYVPVKLDIPRVAILGVIAFIALLFVTSVRPFLIWKSPSLLTPDGIFPLHGLTFEISRSRNENIPDMVIIRSGYNVGRYGIAKGEAGAGSNIWFIAPCYLFGKFGRHLVLYVNLFKPKHTFMQDLPWLGETLESMGYKQETSGVKQKNQTIYVGVNTFIQPVREYELFDVAGFKATVEKVLDDIREPERLAIEDILNKSKKIRQARGEGEQTKPAAPAPAVVYREPDRR